MRTSFERLLLGDTSGVMLMPEVTSGPYYISGEVIRTNLVEDQPGVPLTLDVQIVDVDTCEPVPGIWLDFWQANATGVYSGVVGTLEYPEANMSLPNGDPNDSENSKATFLRGLTATDEAGVATVETIFPGHYELYVEVCGLKLAGRG